MHNIAIFLGSWFLGFTISLAMLPTGKDKPLNSIVMSTLFALGITLLHIGLN
jgi:hypothetical protein